MGITVTQKVIFAHVDTVKRYLPSCTKTDFLADFKDSNHEGSAISARR